ncbi:M20/M25/M40 family metallo-hydrolase [Sinobaca sp. H24]|uniref:M20/M25/M40 family metallo-hydrolase n=1 Tax=Sinobaca sp. H24 TaxID=2923376 RepID=UPI00207A69B4|nr:M20/M25/M40 family metallo-hydrolase [Sinobaca sp. H24]
MDIRSDAALAMAEVMMEVEQAAVDEGGVGTVGKLKVYPDGINIIPAKQLFPLISVIQIQLKRAYALACKAVLSSTREKAERTYRTPHNETGGACFLHRRDRRAIAESCVSAGLPVYEMNGAGHDALILGEHVPFGMIFVRSRQGISHHPDEWSDEADCIDGANVLLETMRRLAE